jgi:hypothetical protein
MIETSLYHQGFFIELPKANIYRFGLLALILIILPMFLTGIIFVRIDAFTAFGPVLFGACLLLAHTITTGRWPRSELIANRLLNIIGLAILSSLSLFQLFQSFSVNLIDPLIIFYAFLLQPLGIILLLDHMNQKTALGSNIALQAQGLKRTLKTGQWGYRIQEKQNFVDQVLPLAIALGIADTFASGLDELEINTFSSYSGESLTERSYHRPGFFHLLFSR